MKSVFQKVLSLLKSFFLRIKLALRIEIGKEEDSNAGSQESEKGD